MPDFHILLILNLVVTSMMTGVIWLVQLVHYPLFAGLDRTSLVKWHAFHSSRITWIVAPLMLVELALCVPLFLNLYSNGVDYAILTVIITTQLIWAFTFCISVPIHNQISRGQPTDPILRKLVLTNWPRTVVYSVKLIVLMAMAL